jgi:hypothetical protein
MVIPFNVLEKLARYFGFGSPPTRRERLSSLIESRALNLRRTSTIYARLVTTPSTVYVVGLAKSFGSYTLHVTSLSSSTGDVVASVNFPSSIVEGSSAMLVLSSGKTTINPRIVWLEAGAIRSVSLVPRLTDKPTSAEGSEYGKIINVGLESKGYFVALKTDDTSRVLRLDTEKGILEVIWEFVDSVSVHPEGPFLLC